MRKLLLALPLLALFGCAEPTNPEERKVALEADAKAFLSRSTIVCADGNQVRVAIYGWQTRNSAVTAGWTILDDTGKPKRCVKRAKALQPQYEEVPQ